MAKTGAERIAAWRERHLDRLRAEAVAQSQKRADYKRHLDYIVTNFKGRISIHHESTDTGVTLRWDMDPATQLELYLYADSEGLGLIELMAMFDNQILITLADLRRAEIRAAEQVAAELAAEAEKVDA